MLAKRFGLSKDEFAGRHVLDVGCGPTGRMEYFDRAMLSVGLDPLAERYRDDMGGCMGWYDKLYTIPIEQYHETFHAVFDRVVSFNALDHGYNLAIAIRNIADYLCPGGIALLSVGCDVIHMPNACHPLKIHPAAFTACLVAAGLDIVKQDQGGLPTGEDGHIVFKETCTGGPVFHWTARKPEQ